MKSKAKEVKEVADMVEGIRSVKMEIDYSKKEAARSIVS